MSHELSCVVLPCGTSYRVRTCLMTYVLYIFDRSFEFLPVRDQHSRDPILDDTSCILEIIGDDRESTCHRFQIDESKGISLGWKDEYIHTPIDLREFLSTLCSEE